MNTDDIALIPFPAKLRLTGGTTPLPCGGTLTLMTRTERTLADTMADQLLADLRQATGMTWQAVYVTDANEWPADIALQLDESVPAGEYRLSISAERTPLCTLAAADERTLLTGTQTLRQLLRTHGAMLPSLQIIDQPAMNVRAASYDVSRGRVPTLATLKRLADELCLLKYNQLQLYVEHVFAFPKTSEAWRAMDPLRPNEIRELDSYCAARGIELVPALASFGHMYEILRSRSFRPLGEHPEHTDRPFNFIERMLHHTVDPTNPGSFELVTSLIDEYSCLFQSRTFNIGGDETFDLGTGASKAQADAIGLPRLYADFISKLCNHLTERGITPMLYADIAIKHPELLDILPPTATLANWDYLAKPNVENVAKVASSGHRQLVCPGVQTWNRLLPDLDAAWSNIASMCRAGHEHGAEGMLVTDWGDYGHVNDPVMSLPGFAYAAECAWNIEPTSRQAVDRAASILLFGDTTGKAMATLGRSSATQAFSWADAVQWLEISEGDGTANRDVMWVLGQDGELDELDNVAAARKHFLANRRESLERRDLNDRTLREIRADLARLMPSTTGDHADMGAMLLMTEGQMLLNAIGAWIIAGCGIDMTLASRIETWTDRYTNRWDTVAKRSRLDDMRRVLWTYADMMRGGMRS